MKLMTLYQSLGNDRFFLMRGISPAGQRFEYSIYWVTGNDQWTETLC